MAIIIPSTNTFELSSGLVLNNRVTSYEVKSKDISYGADINKQVYSLSQAIPGYYTDINDKNLASYTEPYREFVHNTQFYSGGTSGVSFCGSFAYAGVVFCDIMVSFKALTKNGRITSVYDGMSNENKPNVQVSIEYSVSEVANPQIAYRQTVKGGDGVTPEAEPYWISFNGLYPNDNVKVTNTLSNSDYIKTIAWAKNIRGEDISSTAKYINYENTKTFNVSYYPFSDLWSGGEGAYLTIAASIIDCFGVIGNISQTPTSNDPHCYVSGTPFNYDADGIAYIGGDKFYGRCVQYFPKTLSISINGDIQKIDISDVVRKVGQDSTYVITNTDNELLQVADTKKQNLDANAISTDFSKVISNYKNGKQIITLKCAIDDYFDNNGNLAISKQGKTNKMSFSIYDEVVPMIRNQQGRDVPLALLPNGDAKTFKVLGTNFVYDGAIWQELTLQESGSVIVDLPNTYAIEVTGEKYPTDVTYRFNIKGRGDIYINDILLDTVDYTERTLWSKAFNDFSDDYVTLKFVGDFEEISPTTTSSGTDSTRAFGGFGKVKNWGDTMYPYMFYYCRIALIGNATIPSKITKIANNAYTYTQVEQVESAFELHIPKQINEIGAQAFSNSEITNFVFEQRENDFVRLPIAGSETGMFYSKSATNKNIYTENWFIKNYDYATDNITPTFYHLDGTLWE